MSKRKRWLACLLLGVLLANCIGFAAAADAATPLFSVTATSGRPGSTVSVTVNALVGGVITDGKLEIGYDPLSLEFVELTEGGAWERSASIVTSVNDSENGVVIFAFTADTPANEGAVFTLKFKVLEAVKTTVSLDAGESYVHDASGYDLSAGATVDGNASPSTTPGTGAGGGGTGTGTGGGSFVPGGDVPCPSAGFTDLAYTGEFHDAIDYMVENGYMYGISDTQFAPDSSMTRAMMVTILYRIEGAPTVDAAMPFGDVPEGAYYYDAVRWAAGCGVTTGTTDTTFDPNAPLTREQIVTFLCRYAELKGADTTASGDLSGYTDLAAVHPYAVDTMSWGVGSGVIKGVSTTVLDPLGNATRAQVAVMTWRLLTSGKF